MSPLRKVILGNFRENQMTYYVDYQKHFFKEICESVAFLAILDFSEWTQNSILIHLNLVATNFNSWVKCCSSLKIESTPKSHEE